MQNFKCFENKREIRFSRFTFIHGRAGSGKSSITHAVRILTKTYMLTPIVRDLDFSVLNVEEILPKRDPTKRTRLELEGSLRVPYIKTDLLFDIELSLSISDGILSTGVRIGETTMPKAEMLQSMFSYVCKEYREGRYSVKLEAHYLTQSIFNIKAVYPRITVIDREEFVVLFQDTFPRLLERGIKVVDCVRNIVDYSIRPGLETKFTKMALNLLIDPQLKRRVSKLLTEVTGRDIILDFRKIENREEYVLENVVQALPLSAHETSLINLVYMFTAEESLPDRGTLIVDDFDSFLSDELLERTVSVLSKRALERELQLILLFRYRENLERAQKVAERFCREDISVVEL